MVAQEHFVKGNAKLESGDYKGAVKEYRRARKYHAERWDIAMNLGITYSRAGKFTKAINQMEEALRLGGDKELICYFNLGNVYQERGMYPQSVDAYRAALAQEPDKPHVDTLINLASAYMFMYQYDNAKQTYEYTRSLVPDDPRPVHGIALVLQAQNLYQQSYEMYENVHRIDPNFAMSYLNKSWVLAALDRYPEAIRSLETYLQKDPKGPYVRRANTMLRVFKSKLAQKNGGA